jgi:hypothetical protein
MPDPRDGHHAEEQFTVLQPSPAALDRPVTSVILVLRNAPIIPT